MFKNLIQEQADFYDLYCSFPSLRDNIRFGNESSDCNQSIVTIEESHSVSFQFKNKRIRKEMKKTYNVFIKDLKNE